MLAHFIQMCISFKKEKSLAMDIPLFNSWLSVDLIMKHTEIPVCRKIFYCRQNSFFFFSFITTYCIIRDADHSLGLLKYVICAASQNFPAKLELGILIDQKKKKTSFDLKRH